MKKMIFLAEVILFLFFIIGCSKKKEQELTPLNAPREYGKIMERAMKKAKSMDSIIYLRNKIHTFQLQEGRYPYSLDELIEKGYINKEEMPKPPEGMQFVYDPKTGKVEVK